VVKLLLAFVAGLGLGYLRGRIIRALVLSVAVAFLLSAFSLIPYRLGRYGDVQYLLPFSYPLHAEIQTFGVILVFPTPPHLRLTIHFINAPILVRWYHTMLNASLTSFAIFLCVNLATIITGIFLGRLIHGRLYPFPEKTQLHT
jgi:hypothetical protein